MPTEGSGTTIVCFCAILRCALDGAIHFDRNLVNARMGELDPGPVLPWELLDREPAFHAALPDCEWSFLRLYWTSLLP